MHLLPEPGVRDHQPPRVEHVVADQAVEEGDHLAGELVARGGELRQRLGQPVAHLDVAAAQRAQQLGLVVARHAQGGPRGHHLHHRAQHAGRVGAAVGQVAEEHRGPSRRVAAHPAGVRPVAELVQQRVQLRQAAVHVADDVERPVQARLVAPGRLAHDLRAVHLGHPAELEHPAESFPLQPAHRPGQRRVLAPDHPRAERPVRARRVPLDTDLLGHVEDDRHRQHVVLPGQGQQRPAGVRLHVGRVDHGELAELEPLGGDRVQRLERRRGDRLVVLVVPDQAAERVRGEHLGRPETTAGKG